MDVFNIVENLDPLNKNMGGGEDELYYALLGDFSAIPEPPITETDPEDKFTVTTGITFKSGKCWKKIQAQQDSVKLGYEAVGNAGALQAALMFAIPGNNIFGHVLSNIADQNTPYVFLVKRNCNPAGTYDLVGSFKHKANLKGGHDNGEKAGNGALYNFEARSTNKFEVHYTGAVVLTPAS